MPSKPFLVFWYILSACALGTQRNILHHWASTQIRLSNMLNDMTIDKKKYKKPFAQARYTRKRKRQAAANIKPRIILCTSREIPKKNPQNTQKKERLHTLHSPLYSKETTKQLLKKVTNKGHY
jgi:hypothetical protein